MRPFQLLVGRAPAGGAPYPRRLHGGVAALVQAIYAAALVAGGIDFGAPGVRPH